MRQENLEIAITLCVLLTPFVWSLVSLYREYRWRQTMYVCGECEDTVPVLCLTCNACVDCCSCEPNDDDDGCEYEDAA